MALTQRQKQVLDFIADFIEENGYSPSYDELAHALQLSSLATVHKHVQALETRGYLRRGFNQSRSIEVAEKYLQERRQSHLRAMPPPRAEVPLAGRIVAGKPLEAVESKEVLQFADFVGRGETFGLQVTGDSMIEDHICNGDYVLIERTSEAQNGEIVVALVGSSETTLKRFYREPGGQIRLQPANAAMEPMYYGVDDVQVQGRLLAVMRKYK